MKARTVLLAASLLATASAGASTIDYIGSFTSFIALGDSLSDPGVAPALAPPSLDGRFSNGRVFPEFLSDDFQAEGLFTLNLAIGGATAENDNETVYPTPEATAIGTFQGQAAVLGAQQASNPLFAGAVGDNPLVSVLFGANDLFQDLGEGSFVGEIGENAADAVADGIRSLNSMSSVFDSFVVTNLPDLSLTPGFAGGPFAGLAQAESLAFNARLSSNLDGLRASGLEIFEADINQQLLDIIADPAAFGLTDVVNSCTPSLTVPDPANNCTFTGTGFDVSLADGFLFIDDVHPNTIAHAAFADRIRAEIAPVNLPASMPMIAAGVLALGWVGRRKRA